MTTTKARKRLAGTTKRLAEAVRSARRDIAAVEARDELTEEAKRAAIDARRKELHNEVDVIEEHAKDAVAAIRSAAPEPPAIDSLEAMRIWQRQQRELDSGADPIELARRLAGEGDRTAFQVLAEELPSYLRAQGHTATVQPALTELRSEEASLLSDEEASHRRDVTAAESALERVSMNAGLVRMDGETVDLLVGVGDGENIGLRQEN